MLTKNDYLILAAKEEWKMFLMEQNDGEKEAQQVRERIHARLEPLAAEGNAEAQLFLGTLDLLHNQ